MKLGEEGPPLPNTTACAVAGGNREADMADKKLIDDTKTAPFLGAVTF